MKKGQLTKLNIDTRIQDLKKSILTPKKLHKFMAKYNWDDGIAVPFWAIRNSICDKGTALMIYWMAGAGYYSQYKSRKNVPKFQRDNFDLIIEIEKRCIEGFYTQNNITFDPRYDIEKNNRGHDWVNEYSDLKQVRKIPEDMLFANKSVKKR